MWTNSVRRCSAQRVVVVAVMWITGGCERANLTYLDMANEAVADLADLASGKDLANGSLCGQTMGMVQVMGGSFQMGADDIDAATKPVNTQTLAGFWMDETEVTVNAYGRCVAAGACTAAGGIDIGNFCNTGVAGKEQHPINCVDFFQAQAYCQWQCKRLPTEIEWEYAARGSRGSLYPWGNDQPNTMNKKETDLCWNTGRTGTCAVKSYTQSSTLLGTVAGGGIYDLAGNVWEWTTSYYSCSYPLNKNKPTDPVTCGEISNMSPRVIRGGSWSDIDDPIHVRAAFRYGDGNPLNRAFRVGFRCLQTL